MHMAPRIRWWRLATLTGGFLLATTPAPATETLDAPLGRMAYAALQADEELADLNLGVKALQGGTVILWGPSPSPILTKKAEALLKKLPGVVHVRVECDRDAVIDPLVQRVEAEVKGTPPRVVERPPTVPPVTPARQVTTVEKPRADAPPPAATLLEPLPVEESESIAIERIRKSDSRFAKLVVEVRDGRVVISGTVSDPADAWAFAKKIAPHVGDKNIVVRRSR